MLLCTYFLQVNTAYVPAKVCNEGEVCCHVQSVEVLTLFRPPHSQFWNLSVQNFREFLAVLVRPILVAYFPISILCSGI